MYLATVSNGNLGGVTGADATCNSHKPSGFSGTAKAMIVTNSSASPARYACSSGTNVDCRSTSTNRSDWPFAADQTYCTDDYTRTIGTTNTSGILIVSSSNSMSTSASSTFTGVNIYMGTSEASHCSNWTSTSGSAVNGSANGSYTGTGTVTFFANGASQSCNSAGTIYCVEQ